MEDKAVSEKVEDGKTSKPGNKYRGKGKEKKTEQIEQFQMNKYVPKFSLAVHEDGAAYSDFTMDCDHFVDIMVEHQYPMIQRAEMLHQNITLAQCREIIERTTYFLLGKKLSYASTAQEIASTPIFSTLRKTPILSPDSIVQVVEGVGVFELYGQKFKPRYQSLLPFDCYVRAVGTAGADGLPQPINGDHIYVDQTSHFIDPINDWLNDQFLNFIKDTGLIDLNIAAGVQVNMYIPETENYNANYLAYLQGIGVPLNARLTSILEVLINIANGNIFAGMAMNEQMRLAFAACGVILVNWNAQVKTRLVDEYNSTVERRFSMLMAQTFKMVTVTSMMVKGEPWQVATSDGHGGVYCPFTLSDTQMGLAVMMLGVVKDIKFNIRQTNVRPQMMTVHQLHTEYVSQATQKM